MRRQNEALRQMNLHLEELVQHRRPRRRPHARIFHVVDAFDAMTSERPYRSARPFAEARAEVIRCSGTQFDPGVVEAFLAVAPEEWERIRREVEAAAGLGADPRVGSAGTGDALPTRRAL